MTDKDTVKFTVPSDDKENMRRILRNVYEALTEKGYNPVNQIVGLLLRVRVNVGALRFCKLAVSSQRRKSERHAHAVAADVLTVVGLLLTDVYRSKSHVLTPFPDSAGIQRKSPPPGQCAPIPGSSRPASHSWGKAHSQLPYPCCPGRLQCPRGLLPSLPRP